MSKTTEAKVRRRRSKANRPHSLPLRMSAEERSRWDREAERCSLSLGAWIARTCDAAAKHRAGPSELAEHRDLLGEIGEARLEAVRAGVNLNQIAARFNAGDEVSVEALHAALAAIEEAHRQLSLAGEDTQRTIRNRRLGR